MIIRIPSPYKALGKNKAGGHPLVRYQQKAAWEEVTAWAYKSQRHGQSIGFELPHDIRVALPMDRPNRADPHNFTSYEVAWIIDGLVKVGLLADDTGRHVTVHDPVLYKRPHELRNQPSKTPVIVAIDEPLPEELK